MRASNGTGCIDICYMDVSIDVRSYLQGIFNQERV